MVHLPDTLKDKDPEGRNEGEPGFLQHLHGLRVDLTNLMCEEGVNRTEDEQLVIGILEDAAGLSYDEYRALDGALQDMRRNVPGAVQRLGEVRGERAQELVGKFLCSNDGKFAQKADKFAADCIIVLRMGFPYGKNMVNPSAEPGIRSSLSAATPMDIRLSSTVHAHVKPNPNDGGASTIVHVDGKEYDLHSGGSIIVGRPLEQSQLFNRSLRKPISLEVRGK